MSTLNFMPTAVGAEATKPWESCGMLKNGCHEGPVLPSKEEKDHPDCYQHKIQNPAS